jgi:UDP-glucose 4-epimerase
VTRILVTGAAGFLGFYIARQLGQSPENSVVCVDSFVRGRRDVLYRELTSRTNVRHVTADLCDPAAVAALPDDIDVVFHMAALNGTQNFYERPFEVVRCCTLPTMHLLEKYGPKQRLKRWLYAGTSEAYASTVTRFGWEVPTGEEVPLGIDDVFNARWSYAASKMHGEIATTACPSQLRVSTTPMARAWATSMLFQISTPEPAMASTNSTATRTRAHSSMPRMPRARPFSSPMQMRRRGRR